MNLKNDIRHTGESPKVIYELLSAQIHSEIDRLISIAHDPTRKEELVLRGQAVGRLQHALDWFVEKILGERRKD